ncbi:FixH family protein [Gracilibacillus kekensis]|uniref:YtkA-like n=1 Tax=Gracilibacillus kekensis TaxID=1027249 RepID=A0A1M7IEQ6_9BACI|nr:FixH family protein [Gracilibacillus kekensis]SHM39073.1 YtkA-like [Gracilibacillus kekensis]
MKKILWIILLTLFTMTACANQGENEPEQTDEVKGISVDFELAEEADTGESVELKATVTYGEDELVTDAEEVSFEYWNVEDEENTVTIDASNNEDGTYTADVVFDQPGTYEIYAHTTAKDMHTMPKKSIVINGDEDMQMDEENHQAHSSEDHSHHEGFLIELEEYETVTKEEDVEWTVQLKMDQEPYQNARVRYEIIPEASDQHIWLDAEETDAGTYTSNHSFSKTGEYEIVVHVTDDSGLHEHKEYTFKVIE